MVETPDGVRVEFAVRDGAVIAWMRDDGDRPIPSSAVTGKATLLVGAKKLEMPLQPEGDGLIGQGDVTGRDKLTAVLNLAVNGKPVVVRFVRPPG
ncbi:MAG: hypothetical protein HZC25_02735 [Rhodospirillales bacterium]|nr:hypothetical protein [Rhodospirillales bacterium]